MTKAQLGNDDGGTGITGTTTKHPISSTPHSNWANLIEKTEVRPSAQRSISLGSFTSKNPPRGFSVEINPDPFPADSVQTAVETVGSSEQYELVLHIANTGAEAILAEVWQL